MAAARTDVSVSPLSVLERLAAEATAGEWTPGFSLLAPWEVWSADGMRLVAYCGPTPPDPNPVQAEKDAAFIAACDPATVAALTRLARAAKAFEADLSEFCDGPERDELRASFAVFVGGQGEPTTEEEQ